MDAVPTWKWLLGIFFLVAALPTFLLVRNRTRAAPGFEGAGPVRLIRAGFREFVRTFETARKNRVLFQFLAAFMVYMAGLDAIVKFVGIYAEEAIRFTTDIPHMPNWGQPLLLGPGSILVAHTKDEFVLKKDLEHSVKLYLQLAKDLLSRPAKKTVR